MRPRLMKLIWIGPLAILGLLFFVFLGGEIVKLLWNWLLPPLFGLPRIAFWQALGLLVLSRILFGGCGWRGSMRSRIRQRIEDRCAGMTPEERERFRERIREKWGFGPSTGESQQP